MPDGQQLYHLDSDEEEEQPSGKGATLKGRKGNKADHTTVEVVDLSEL